MDLSPEELAKLITGINNAQIATEIDPHKANKAIAIIGEPKTGKSWLAATIAPAVGPTYVFDLDNRAQSLAGKPNLIIKTYVDVVQNMPKAFNELKQDVERFKYKQASGDPLPCAFIVDSLSFLKRITENAFFAEMGNKKVDMFREVRINATDSIRIPQGYDAINGVRDFCLYLFAELRSLGHLIVVFHERPISDKVLSTPTRTVYTGKTGIDPPFLNTLLTVFDDVWRIELDSGGDYKVYVKANSFFNGSTSLQGLDAVESPDIAAMMKKNAEKINSAKG